MGEIGGATSTDRGYYFHPIGGATSTADRFRGQTQKGAR